MLLRWIPWNYLIGRAARAYGIIDPIQVIAKIRRFSQPSEVQEPLELLRAGIIFQARGLINTRVIQFNLDWIWPFWIEKQFNPADRSFVPRAFSFSHVNITQRNWTAVGCPQLPIYTIVDPRGLVTPLYDGWSLDFWFLPENGKDLLPSKLPKVSQSLLFDPYLAVVTQAADANATLSTTVWMTYREKDPVLHIEVKTRAQTPGRLAIVVRPYNPEGISFIEQIAFQKNRCSWLIDGKTSVIMGKPPHRLFFSNYHEGDVYHRLARPGGSGRSEVRCPMGMASAAVIYSIPSGKTEQVQLSIPLSQELQRRRKIPSGGSPDWGAYLSQACKAKLPDAKFQYLFDSAVRTLVLLSADEIYPGPYSYRRFWFRDACLMIHALLMLNLKQRSQRLLQRFTSKQKTNGYFESQQGEWDSNGQVLWIMDRYQQVTGQPLPSSWIRAIVRGAKWIIQKRLSGRTGELHAGLLPAGFSAEHLGPNDFYFWDDFWGISGLRGASRIARQSISDELSDQLAFAANDFEQCVMQAIEAIPPERSRGGIPASPYRRMDAGAIGSMVADYPLQLMPPKATRIWNTLQFLMEHSFFKGGFFQEMVHSGINIYLTLALAQTLLRAGDERYRALMRSVADLASATGNWPEAVHPFSEGGCMGDGQHGWAAAEWVMMIRNMFVREEGERLIIGSGLWPEWLQNRASGPIRFGPTPTCHGDIEVIIEIHDQGSVLHLHPQWLARPAPIEIRIPGFVVQRLEPQPGPISLPLKQVSIGNVPAE